MDSADQDQDLEDLDRKKCFVTLQKLNIDIDEYDSDSSIDLPALPYLNSSSATSKRKSKKTTAELLEEHQNLVHNLKVDCASNITIDETIKRLEVVKVENSVDSSPGSPVSQPTQYQEENFHIFLVNDTLQFFNSRDVTPSKCGFEKILNFSIPITVYEKEMLSFKRVEFEHVISSFLFSSNTFCISDLKSFITYLLRNLSIHVDTACLSACYNALISLLNQHPDVKNLTFISAEIFMILFNYGTDIDSFLFLREWPDVLKSLEQLHETKKNSKEIPGRWPVNFKFTLKSIMKLIENCKFKTNDLIKLLVFMLWMSLDTTLHKENLYSHVQECIYVILETIPEEKWNKVLGIVSKTLLSLQFSSEQEKWKYLTHIVTSIPKNFERGIQLQNLIAFSSLKCLCLKIHDLDGLVFDMHEFQQALEHLSGVDSSLLCIAIKFIDICVNHLDDTIEDYKELLNLLKQCEANISEKAHDAKTHMMKILAKLKIFSGENVNKVSGCKSFSKKIKEENFQEEYMENELNSNETIIESKKNSGDYKYFNTDEVDQVDGVQDNTSVGTKIKFDQNYENSVGFNVCNSKTSMLHFEAQSQHLPLLDEDEYLNRPIKEEVNVDGEPISGSCSKNQINTIPFVTSEQHTSKNLIAKYESNYPKITQIKSEYDINTELFTTTSSSHILDPIQNIVYSASDSTHDPSTIDDVPDKNNVDQSSFLQPLIGEVKSVSANSSMKQSANCLSDVVYDSNNELIPDKNFIQEPPSPELRIAEVKSIAPIDTEVVMEPEISVSNLTSKSSDCNILAKTSLYQSASQEPIIVDVDSLSHGDKEIVRQSTHPSPDLLNNFVKNLVTDENSIYRSLLPEISIMEAKSSSSNNIELLESFSKLTSDLQIKNKDVLELCTFAKNAVASIVQKNPDLVISKVNDHPISKERHGSTSTDNDIVFIEEVVSPLKNKSPLKVTKISSEKKNDSFKEPDIIFLEKINPGKSKKSKSPLKIESEKCDKSKYTETWIDDEFMFVTGCEITVIKPQASESCNGSQKAEVDTSEISVIEVVENQKVLTPVETKMNGDFNNSISTSSDIFPSKESSADDKVIDSQCNELLTDVVEYIDDIFTSCEISSKKDSPAEEKVINSESNQSPNNVVENVDKPLKDIGDKLECFSKDYSKDDQNGKKEDCQKLLDALINFVSNSKCNSSVSMKDSNDVPHPECDIKECNEGNFIIMDTFGTSCIKNNTLEHQNLFQDDHKCSDIVLLPKSNVPNEIKNNSVNENVKSKNILIECQPLSQDNDKGNSLLKNNKFPVKENIKIKREIDERKNEQQNTDEIPKMERINSPIKRNMWKKQAESSKEITEQLDKNTSEIEEKMNLEKNDFKWKQTKPLKKTTDQQLKKDEISCIKEVVSPVKERRKQTKPLKKAHQTEILMCRTDFHKKEVRPNIAFKREHPVETQAEIISSKKQKPDRKQSNPLKKEHQTEILMSRKDLPKKDKANIIDADVLNVLQNLVKSVISLTDCAPKCQIKLEPNSCNAVKSNFSMPLMGLFRTSVETANIQKSYSEVTSSVNNKLNSDDNDIKNHKSESQTLISFPKELEVFTQDFSFLNNKTLQIKKEKTHEVADEKTAEVDDGKDNSNVLIPSVENSQPISKLSDYSPKKEINQLSQIKKNISSKHSQKREFISLHSAWHSHMLPSARKSFPNKNNQKRKSSEIDGPLSKVLKKTFQSNYKNENLKINKRSPEKCSPQKSTLCMKYKSLKSPKKFFDYTQMKHKYDCLKKNKQKHFLSKIGSNLSNILREKVLSSSENMNEICSSDSDESDIVELYTDPKRYADKDCLVIYESENIIVID